MFEKRTLTIGWVLDAWDDRHGQSPRSSCEYRLNQWRDAMRRLSLALLVAGTVVSAGSFAQAGDAAPAGMPWFFQGMPDAAQQAAWDLNKRIYGPDTAIPPKYKQLIALAVAAQIP